ncbi:dTDP-4-dehydrorhamnose 3,5-epimerase [Xenorhabdus lircayensis]|uniref:dTDP-4-dehydrorhamnose 3,5-epimerase n=1 Tax=Xenorhabdus lircayensis TaxID=2763499 RepID=A0ABS0U314_9GAMM|nr:dTDP-4-dehydrorhamnose 3,5-epimerase [Xenorhabdus lircayensis]MBI6548017.1 dTDP-4-dehydrorhamnose 3,5-epimerase [Xenorhabdus lircayensis]
MNIIQTKIEDLLIIEPKIFNDERGFFYETYQKQRYKSADVSTDFVQDNRSRSGKGILRGLHFQKTKPQGKLVTVTHGAVFDVAVDLRPNSPTFGQHESIILTGENHLQFYIPPGFAHGFCVLSEFADFQYKCTDYYDPADESGLLWSDPKLSIDWPIDSPILSPKDQALPKFDEIKEKLLQG